MSDRYHCRGSTGEARKPRNSTPRRSPTVRSGPMRAPATIRGNRGDRLTVDFTLLAALRRPQRGPNFKPNESVSFMVVTEDQEETDRYWNAIVGNGGQKANAAGADRWGYSWQITPRVLLEPTPAPTSGLRSARSRR